MGQAGDTMLKDAQRVAKLVNNLVEVAADISGSAAWWFIHYILVGCVYEDSGDYEFIVKAEVSRKALRQNRDMLEKRNIWKFKRRVYGSSGIGYNRQQLKGRACLKFAAPGLDT
jgi:hypothetical protein